MVTETLEAPYSHYLFDAQLSQKIDQRTIEEMHIDSFSLMEIAGSSAAKHLLEHHPNLSHGVYLCGKGNNAGDALVIARYLLQHNIQSTVIFVSGTDDLSDDTDKNLTLLKNFDTDNQLTVIEDWDSFNTSDFDFIVDGLLGTGLNSDVRGDYAKAVNWANEQHAPAFSMDIPTGLHADSGHVMGCAIEADHTFAFGGRKLGFYLGDGPELTGQISYCELPFPNQYKKECLTYLLDEWISMESPAPGQHKYDSGVLYIIAGSEGLTGAAIMAAQSTWAEGLGAVILICPRGVLSIYEQTLPSIIKKPVGAHENLFFRKEHVDEALAIVNEKEGNVLLGPGLGRDDSTVTFTHQFLAQNTADAIVDADGLWALAQQSEWDKPEQSNWVLTPHPGELQTLTGTTIDTDTQRLNLVRNFAQNAAVTIFSKGMPGILGTPSGKCYLTNYNTRYFARAGTGDVLAGKIGAFTALGFAADQSCAMALLRGKQKLDHFLEHNNGLPEPTDFI